MDKTVEIDKLALGYKAKKREKQVATHLCATIFKGELTCLLGANGVGKSTLLRTLSGFQPPLSGNICILGKSIKAYSHKELSQIIGVVLTDKAEIGNLTVREVVALGRNPYTGFWGKLSASDETAIDRAIASVKIETLTERLVHTLSDGERQKVMIAKALAQETPVILLDEPTAFLDYPSKIGVMRLLHDLTRQTDKTIFLTTHDLELALQIADKLWLMEKNAGIVAGTPEELIAAGNIENFFQCEGMSFDRKAGLFRINKRT
jgi:iron complex transport system ATP-binding protein